MSTAALATGLDAAARPPHRGNPTNPSGGRLTHLIGLGRLAPVNLADLVDRADLQHRVDRKYLVPVTAVQELVGSLVASHQVLVIAERRYTSYRSTYFDTPDLGSVRAHIQGRRRRWKIRSRLYVEDGLCRFELKTKTGRGATTKAIAPSDPSRYGQLAGLELEFVSTLLARHGIAVDPAALIPTAELGCVRATLADLSSGTRVTIDWNVRATTVNGATWIDPGHLIVETKGGPAPATADRTLIRMGARPRAFSKYVAAASSLHPDIPDNDVRALQGRILHVAAAHA
jgi:hypothetical protein